VQKERWKHYLLLKQISQKCFISPVTRNILENFAASENTFSRLVHESDEKQEASFIFITSRWTFYLLATKVSRPAKY